MSQELISFLIGIFIVDTFLIIVILWYVLKLDMIIDGDYDYKYGRPYDSHPLPPRR